MQDFLSRKMGPATVLACYKWLMLLKKVNSLAVISLGKATHKG